ncbi:MAG TPA: RDD family protein, partial [Candidatus Hodarchaeales archaeon]|nr:RDD family protein [Candidatus Hodarchaeales archaeon]
IPTADICSFWSRIVAFLVDTVVLGVVGLVLGLAFYSQFSHLGGYGRVIGFMIAAFYFGVMNSVICGGQTIGKRVMKIKVITKEGKPIGIGRSVVRFLIIGTPFFLNGAPIPMDILQSVGGSLIASAIFGLGLSILYMYVFNRNTRQSLHDVIVGSFVSKAEAGKIRFVNTVWKGHYAILAVILIGAGLLPIVANHFSKEEPFKEMLTLQRAIQKQPEAKYSSVTAGKTTMNIMGKGARETTFLSSRIVLSKQVTDYDQVANTMARVVLNTYPEAESKDSINIVLSYGYDIGIASSWNSKNYNYSPGQWKERIQQSNQAL